MQDKHFDGHESRFEKNIYQTNKGKLRLELLKTQLSMALPSIDLSSEQHKSSEQNKEPLTVLDVGGGLGHMTQWCLEQAHHVTYIEPAEKLYQSFCNQSKLAIQNEQLKPFNGSFQDYNKRDCESKSTFDLVICHAVLEWTSDHLQFIEQLTNNLKAGGYISLAFYNQHSIHIANAIKGNLRKLASGNIAGDGTGLTPINPPKTQEVDDILEQCQLECVKKFGVRVLHDYMWKKNRDKISYADLIDMELKYMSELPYRDMGRYCHWIIRKN
jgi:S-adenosylmethionine-dependent methyltransferase